MGKPGTKLNGHFLVKATDYFRSFLEGLSKVANLVQTSETNLPQTTDDKAAKSATGRRCGQPDSNNEPEESLVLHEHAFFKFVHIGCYLTGNVFVIILRLRTKKWTFEHFCKRKRKKAVCQSLRLF